MMLTEFVMRHGQPVFVMKPETDMENSFIRQFSNLEIGRETEHGRTCVVISGELHPHD